MRAWGVAATAVCALVAGIAGCAKTGAEHKATEPEPPVATVATDATAAARPGRALTSAERTLLRPLFGEALDYNAVRVIPRRFIPFQPDNVYMSPEGNIYAPGALYRDDFAAAGTDAYHRSVFVHEALHIWQHQSGINLLAEGVGEFLKGGGDYEAAYPYTLAADRDLLDYGMEQQASIVEDYQLIVTYDLPPQRLQNRSLSRSARRGLYSAVLGNFLADARYARALTPQSVAKRHTELAKSDPPSDAKPAAAHDVEYMCDWRFEPH